MTQIWETSGAFVVYGAGIGGGISYLIARLQSTANRDLARAQREHEAQLAREARRQERIRDGYLTLQLYVSKWGDYANWSASPFRIAGRLRPGIPEISDEEQAIASLVASDDVAALVNEFNYKLQSFRSALGGMDSAGQTADPSDALSTAAANQRYQSVKQSAGDLVETAERVHRQLRKELAGETYPDPKLPAP